MANHHGTEGVIKSGTNAIAEVTGFEITETAEFADDTTLTDTAKTSNSTAITAWSGSLTCFWDETDTNGQISILPGLSVTLKVCPEGYTAGDAYLTGTARITSQRITVQRGSVVEAAVEFIGSGALTRTTV